MLPEHVKMIFLSATTPNMVEFSEWIGRTKKKEVFVISTNTRPVPLEHYLYRDKKKYLVMNNKGHFLNTGYKKVNNIIKGVDPDSAKTTKKLDKKKRPTGQKTQPKKKKVKKNAGKSDWTGLIYMLSEEKLLPCVIFSFSKKNCMSSAKLLLTEDLTSSTEKSKIHIFCKNAIKRLNENDRSLPQVALICKLLKRGIGVHTGGLLPIVKEMVEILFGRGLVKILFATETFAMGVNMPARCVVFNGTKKHDGVEFRDLLPGEYTQMSGRAGRRGLDTVGTVLVAAWGDKLPEVTDLHKMLKGRATKLSSQFRLTYTMILILLRVEDMSVEEMIKRSFTEFSTQNLLGSKNLPSLREKINKALNKLNANESDNKSESCTLCHCNYTDVSHFVELLNKEREMNMKLCLTLNIGFKKTASAQSSSIYEKKLFPQGRLLIIRCALPGGKMMLSNSPSIVVKTNGETVTVVCLCPNDIILSENSDVVDVVDGIGNKDSSKDDGDASSSKNGETKSDYPPTTTTLTSSFMPGTYRRLMNDDIGSCILVMLTIPFTKIVRICKDTFDIDQVLPSKVKNSGGSGGGRRPVLGHTHTKATPPTTKSAFENAVYENDDAVIAISKYLINGGSKTTNSSGDNVHILPEAFDLKELHLNDMTIVQLTEQLGTVRTSINAHPCHGCNRCTISRRPIERISLLKDKLIHIDRVLSNSNLSLFPDFEKKCKILQYLKYTSYEDSVVQLKGRVACEVNTCDELLLTGKE
jgi:superfamily II RNA helicase